MSRTFSVLTIRPWVSSDRGNHHGIDGQTLWEDDGLPMRHFPNTSPSQKISSVTVQGKTGLTTSSVERFSKKPVAPKSPSGPP